MTATLEGVRRLKNELERTHQDRHSDHEFLRHFWHGRYWEVAGNSSSLAQMFRDNTRMNKTDVGPEFKIVRNVLQEVCVKYQTYLSPLPMIRVPTDDPSSTRSRNQANVKEQALYGLWAENEATVKLNHLSWFLPLMGDAFIGAIPDFDNKVVRMVVRSPEYAFPVPSFDLNGQPQAIIFAWKVRESVARREYKDYNASLALPEMSARDRKRDPDPEVEVLEWTDSNEFHRWIGDQKIAGVIHKFGRNLWRQVKFIDVPGETWGHGAVEQSVGRVQLGNALASMIYDAAMNTVYPPLVLTKPQAAPEEIPYGPGAVIPLQEGGSAGYLSAPQGSLLAHAQLLEQNEQSIKQSTSMPDVNFGQFNASIITGAAINELQGAGTGSLVEMVQGVGLGSGLVYWNETALYQMRRLFADDKIYLQGVRPRSRFDLNPQEFAWKHKGSELVGSLRNEVVFSPYIGLHEKLIMNLQAMSAGLVSKKYSREQIAVPDSEAMQEEIVTEAIDDAIIGGLIQMLQQEPSPDNAANTEQQVAAYLTGSPAPHPLIAAQSGPPAAAPAAGGGPPGQPGQPMPQGQPPMPGGPQQSPQGQQPQGAGEIHLGQAINDFQSAAGVQGRVFLVGEIVVQGATAGDIEVALTEGGDRQVLATALPQYAGRMVFHSVSKEPNEAFVEVTPGAGNPAQASTGQAVNA